MIQTEDPSLVKKEGNYIAQIVRSQSTPEKEAAALKYGLVQSSLLRKRDEFIVLRIAAWINNLIRDIYNH